MLANIGPWLLAYVGAVVTAGLAFTFTEYASALILGFAVAEVGAAITDIELWRVFFIFALLHAAFIAPLALPVALAVAVLEAMGRKPPALFCGIAGVLAGIVGLLVFMQLGASPLSREEALRLLSYSVVGGLVGGITMWKLRSGPLGPR